MTLSAPTTTPNMPSIIVSSQDLERLTSLLDTLSDAQREAAAGLEQELARAEVVPPTKVPQDVVTMNSRLVYEDVESGTRTEAVLVYPHEADPSKGRLSILAPVGSALLGLRVGQEIDWVVPSGRKRRIRVAELLYQPQAAGDLHL